MRVIPLCAAALLTGCAAQTTTAPGAGHPGAEALDRLAARFAPVDLVVDLSALPAVERASLARQVEAARVMDALFLRQVWAGNETLLMDLLADRSVLGEARLRNFLLHKGPWDRINERAFIPGVPEKPKGANFYPAGAAKADVEKWIARLPARAAADATGYFHTIRRDAKGRFMAVPYSVEYQGELSLAAQHLREAAALTRQPTLRRYLETRAEALLSNDYYASDVAWMELDATIEPALGPYEVYEDGWFNYKAAFEAFITVRDETETGKLAMFSGQLQDLEDHLPIEPALRNPRIGALAPIRVVNVLFNAGDANRGVQTAAFNLPNDERVIREKGSKRVMLKNVQEAKFNKVLLPISRVALPRADRERVSFDAFFTHILMHELMHGLGPHNITVGGRRTTVRQELKEQSSAFEEAKADISGLWALQYLVDKGVIDARLQETMYHTFLASSFRTLRFGVSGAHGRGMALQLNWLLDQGAVRVNDDGTFAVVEAKIREAVTGLTREIMTIQARGDYAAARAMLERLAVVRPEAQRVIDRLSGVPTDIAPRFVTAESLETP